MEIVYRHAQENRHHIAGMASGRLASDYAQTVFRHDHKVAVAHSNLIVGVPRVKGHRYAENGQRYYYWYTTVSMGLIRKSNGSVVPYHCTRNYEGNNRSWHWHDTSSVFHRITDGDDDASKAFANAVREQFFIEKPQDVYPMMDEYGISDTKYIPKTLGPAFRSDNWAEYAARIFGKTRVTPRLIKAVQNTDPLFVSYAQQFRGLVEDEALAKFMEKNEFSEEYAEDFSPFTPHLRKALLHAPMEVRDILINKVYQDGDLPSLRRFADSIPNRASVSDIERYYRSPRMWSSLTEGK